MVPMPIRSMRRQSKTVRFWLFGMAMLGLLMMAAGTVLGVMALFQ